MTNEPNREKIAECLREINVTSLTLGHAAQFCAARHCGEASVKAVENVSRRSWLAVCALWHHLHSCGIVPDDQHAESLPDVLRMMTNENAASEEKLRQAAMLESDAGIATDLNAIICGNIE